MGAEESRYEYNQDYEDDEIFGPGYLQSPPKAKPGVVQTTTSTLVDIHNDITIGSEISAIRKLTVSVLHKTLGSYFLIYVNVI